MYFKEYDKHKIIFMKRFLVVILQASTMMLALTLVFSCSNQEVSLQTISTEENNPYKWDESFHVNSSTRTSESPNVTNSRRRHSTACYFFYCVKKTS